MAINLQKGQRISLKKEAPNLTRLMCGLGWDVIEKPKGLMGLFSGDADFDLDASVLCLDSQDKLRDKSNIVYFGNLRHASGSVTHLGDNLTGAGDGDDEQILIDLPTIPQQIVKLVFVINIYDCVKRQQEFSQVQNAFVRLVDLGDNREIARYTLSGQQYQGDTGMVLAEVYRHNDEWKMVASGEGSRMELGGMVKQYL
ncbi:MAG: TerD family protein [Coleofasciculaceae cyanobacterium RL_1_1]|nr:TerD family protein [Coleofasciculaceae cyanobacterium RL_1_1]